MPGKTLYYFAVGGTGALTVEPLLILCAAGLGPPRLAITLIDADAGNPAFGRALALLKSYEEVRTSFGSPESGFFSTALIRTKRSEAVWSPLGTDEAAQGGGSTSLADFVEKARMTGEDEDAGALLDLLFSAEQQRERLREGFRGNPAIGSVLMHGLRKSDYFRGLKSSFTGDSESAFFVAGSVFGGTGAAALPVVAQILVAEGIAPSRIGAALMTPYYSLTPPSKAEQQNGRLKPDSDVFLLNTAAALPTYTQGNSEYGTLYVLGDQESLAQPRKVYSAGGPPQTNDPHGVEMFAALATLDFSGREERSEVSKHYYATIGNREPSWGDLPMSLDARATLRDFFLASNFFLHYFKATRTAIEQQDLEKSLKAAAWLDQIGLKADFVRENAAAMNRLGGFFANVWAYLHAITTNFVPMRLVSFAEPSAVRLAMPGEYASAVDVTEFALPMVENCLEGYDARRRKRFGFSTKEADRLEGADEYFSWFNQVPRTDAKGLPGFLRYLHEGTHLFAEQWYSVSGNRQGR
ncbi:MAG: hypothetical protein JWM95_47 [Gemmatimonadetes bacterium]|nr:hypothetical protein [Gemmatimonadota bacterium]